MRRSGRRSEVERSERRKRHSLCDFAARWPNQGARCVSRSFRRLPGIALSAVPFVGDDMGRILRAHGCCYSIPTSAGISPFGARSSDGYLTSDAICPSALRASLKMNRIDHGVHSWPFVGREHRSVCLLPEPVGSVLAIITIWAASPTITRAAQPKPRKKIRSHDSVWQGLLDNPRCEDD
jgi:hypothetical protein